MLFIGFAFCDLLDLLGLLAVAGAFWIILQIS